MLGTLGYRPRRVSTAAAALTALDREKADLVFSDVIMPGMSGRVLAERVALLCPELPVVYMSGYTDDAIVRHGILESDIVFLQKPFTRESLLTKVREAVNRKMTSFTCESET